MFSLTRYYKNFARKADVFIAAARLRCSATGAYYYYSCWFSFAAAAPTNKPVMARCYCFAGVSALPPSPPRFAAPRS
jgi:hypothetical protein